MDVKVEIDAAAVNTMVAEAILQSVIGQQLKEIIERQVQALSRNFDNPIEGVIKHEIATLVHTIVREQFLPQIQEQVRAKVTEQFTSALFDKMWDSFERKYT